MAEAAQPASGGTASAQPRRHARAVAIEATRFFDPVVRPIVKATDLGSVQVLKQGNLYLLSDPFGDVHPDSRGLGLYDGDTRRLSASILRVNGERPVLLQASAGGNYHGAIQLTNPRLERNVADKVRPEDALASQKLGIARKRVIAGGMLEERVRVVNYAEVDEQVEVTLELAADAADIFEVRGWTRVERGLQLPIATRRDRVTFRYAGLDGRRTSTFVALSERADTVEAVEPDVAGSVNAGWVRLHLALPAHVGRRAGAALGDLGGRGAPDGEGRQGRRRRRSRRHAVPARADRRRSTRSPPRYHAWNRSVSEIRTDNELVNLAINRSTSDLPAAGQRRTGRGRALPGRRASLVRDAVRPGQHHRVAPGAVAFGPRVAVETLESSPGSRPTDDDPWHDAEPGKILHELRTGEMARAGETPL